MKYVEYASQAVSRIGVPRKNEVLFGVRFMAKNLWQRWALPAFGKGDA